MNVFSVSHLSVKAKTKAAESKELILRLKALHVALSQLSQDEEEREQLKNLKTIAGQLVSKRFLGHVDKDIRALVCCCIVDILRVFVPESPFSAEELCQIFDTITTLFRGFETHIVTTPDSHGARLLYILKSLSTVRSSVLMVYLTQQAVPGALDTLKQLFTSLISSIRPEHEQAVGAHMASVLLACVEESFDTSTAAAHTACFDQELLDTLLLPLLPTARQENPASYALCQSVLSSSSVLLQGHITQFTNSVLVGTLTESSSRYAEMDSEEEEEEDGKAKKNGFLTFSSSSSELAEHIYSLVYELHKIAPALLLRILPNVCIQLQAEEVTTRLRAVKLLGRLFASPLAHYAQEYKKNFKDFLGRFVDISVDVRKEMIECGFMILKHKHGVATVVAEVEDCMCQRLRDTEWEVRYQALARLLDVVVEEHGVSGPLTDVTVTSLLLAHPESAHTAAVRRDRRGFTLREMAERMKDKRLQIRKVAMIGLAKVYWKHVALWLEPIDLPLSSEHRGRTKKTSTVSRGTPKKGGERGGALHQYGSGVAEEVWQRLRFVPGFILSCWGYPAPEERHLVLQLVQEQIIPKPPKKATSGEGNERENRGAAALAKDERWLWERRRATAFLTMFQCLDNTQKQCLSSILASKAKTRQELSVFLGKWTQQLHQPALPGGKKRIVAANPVLHRATLRLLTHFPPTTNSGSGSGGAVGVKKPAGSLVNLENLFASKDKSVRRLLLQAIDPRLPTPSSRLSNVHNSVAVAAEVTRACTARDDLKSRLESKSPLAQYIGSLYDASAAFMLLNPVTVEIILRYVAGLCQQLGHCEGVIYSSTSSGRGSSNSVSASAVKEAKGRLGKLQQEVEMVCQLLVTMGKHSPRSFTDVAGYLEEWLASICERISSSSVASGPSLWRDAALSFYYQLIKSVKQHLYCTEMEDALVLSVRQQYQQLEETNDTDADVRNACRRARRSSLASLCTRSLRYSLCIGESQVEGNHQVDEFIKQLQVHKHKEILALSRDDDDEEEEEKNEEEETFLGTFSAPMQACSFLAESVALIIEGGSISDEDMDSSSGFDPQSAAVGAAGVTLIRKRALCDLLGVSATLRFLLSSMTSPPPSAGKKTPSTKQHQKKNITSRVFMQGDFENLALQCLSTRLRVAAALLESFEDNSSIGYTDIVTSNEVMSRSSVKSRGSSRGSSVLATALSLVQADLLGSGRGQNCGEFPSSLSAEQLMSYQEKELSAEEQRPSTLFQRQGEEGDTGSSDSDNYGECLMGALRMYTAVAMQLETLHFRAPPAIAGNKRRSGGRNSNAQAAKNTESHKGEPSSPFRERLEEEYELTIEEEELSGKVSTLEDRFPPHMADLMTYLLSIIRSRGRYLDQKRAVFDHDMEAAEENTAVHLRETAGQCLLQLLTLKRVNKNLLPSEWLTVASLLLDPNPDCRHSTLSRLCSLMQTHCLHPRFLALPCLAVLPMSTETETDRDKDDEAVSSTSTSSHTKMASMIQNSLLFALKRLRCTHESLCAQVMSISASMDDPDLDSDQRAQLQFQSMKLQRTAEDNTPEGIFPYVLYLLSRPPAFPASVGVEEVVMKQAESTFKSLRMIISILVKSLRNSSGDNIALLLKQVDVIARFYQDRLIALESPPSSSSSAESLKRKTGSRREKGTGHDNGKEALWEQYDRLQVVAQLAQQVLTGLIKTQENVQPYLGDVNLPMDLFELRAKSDLEMEMDRTSAARLGFRHLLSRAPSAPPPVSTKTKSKKRTGAGVTEDTGSASTSVAGSRKSGGKKSTKTTAASKAATSVSSSSKSSSGSSLKKQKTATSRDRDSSSSSSSSSSGRSSGSRRRGGQAVNYQDTRDSDDEEEMEQIEELLSSQSQSKRKQTSVAVPISSLKSSLAPIFRQSAGSLVALQRVSGVGVGGLGGVSSNEVEEARMELEQEEQGWVDDLDAPVRLSGGGGKVTPARTTTIKTSSSSGSGKRGSSISSSEEDGASEKSTPQAAKKRRHLKQPQSKPKAAANRKNSKHVSSKRN